MPTLLINAIITSKFLLQVKIIEDLMLGYLNCLKTEERFHPCKFIFLVEFDFVWTYFLNLMFWNNLIFTKINND